MKSLLKHLAQKHGFKIEKYHRLSGGDISDVYHLETTEDDLVIKINSADKKPMFLSEQKGLNELRSAHSFRIPQVYDVDVYQDQSYILMEFIATGKPNENTFKAFGENLCQLHAHTANTFGFDSDNLIGSLPQKNKKYTQWNLFYWEQRIKPQYQLALEKNLIGPKDIPHKDIFLEVIENEFCESKPSLLHGDLWNGNYLVDDTGKVALIDPAVYYGHPMMDIGISQLFGGFPMEFLSAYRNKSTCEKNWQNQIELAQWYFLLVHLNLFGKSYLGAVQRIKDKYMYA